MRRREFITLLGGAAAAWPLAARAQQQQMPTVGFLGGLSATDRPELTEALRQGLNDAGYNEGRNVKIEYRYADNRKDQIPALATDVINRRVAVIAALRGQYRSGRQIGHVDDSNRLHQRRRSGRGGLVTSLNRPEANVTGVSWFLRRALGKASRAITRAVPQADMTAGWQTPNYPEGASYRQSARTGPAPLGGGCSSSRQVPRRRWTPRLRGSTAGARFMLSERIRSIPRPLATSPFWRHGMVSRWSRGFGSVRGGRPNHLRRQPNGPIPTRRTLSSYSRGARTADIPIDRATRFELVINLATAKALGLEFPSMLLLRADEVID